VADARPVQNPSPTPGKLLLPYARYT